MVGEIRRSADDGHPDIRPDTDRDHVLLDDVAETDAGIDAVRDDVGQVVVDDHVHPNIRVGRKEGRQDRHDDGRDRMLGRGDAKGAGGLPPQGAYRIDT